MGCQDRPRREQPILSGIAMNIELTSYARRILPWIIEQSNNVNEMTAFKVTLLSALHTQLWDAVNDPVALAKVTVHELQRCGVCAHFADVDDVVDTRPNDAEWLCLQPEQGEHKRIIWTWRSDSWETSTWYATMYSVRLILTKLVVVDDKDRARTELILRGLA